MDSLSQRQRLILDVIKRSMEKRGYPPTVREIGAAVGLCSTCTVHKHLNSLEQRGYIRRNPLISRSVMLAEDSLARKAEVVELPLVGRVAAGVPLLASENVEDMVPLPLTITRGRDAFILRVVGESMIGDGLLDGDYVVVARQQTAVNGDLVVALIGEEATVKRFYLEAGMVRLQPSNPMFQPIILRDAAILGKVIASYRSY